MKKTLFIGLLALTGIAKAQWSLTGNAGTNPTTNFIGTTDAKDLVFKTNNSVAGKFLGNANRTFVIGTINPSPQAGYAFFVTGKSQLNGDAYISGNSYLNGNVTVGDPNYISYNNINTNATFLSAGTSAFYLPNGGSSFKITDSSLGWNYMRVAASDEYTSVVYLQEDGGKVLIGGKSTNLYNCNSCNDYRLFVKDGIKTEKVKVDIAAENGWADYVFAKEYKLMPLQEVENYIQTNGHLPEVPSTEEAIKNGIELKEMNILLLKKVEELTLHLIKQDKRIEELEANGKK